MSCRLVLLAEDGTCAAARELSPAAVASSSLLTAIMNSDDATGDGGAPSSVEIQSPHATPRSFAAVLEFMSLRRDSSRSLPHPKPLWFDGAEAALDCAAIQHDVMQLVMDVVQDDATYLVEITRTADYLQVETLVDSCCALFAVRMMMARGRPFTAIELDLPAPVLARLLAFMPGDAQERALADHQVLRREVGLYVVRLWFEDLRDDIVLRGEPPANDVDDDNGRPWLMIPATHFRGGPSSLDARLMRVAEYMRDRRYVPEGLTPTQLSEFMDRVLPAASTRSVAVGIFSVAVAGPLAGWLRHALHHLGMEHWIVSQEGLRGDESAFLRSLQPSTCVRRPLPDGSVAVVDLLSSVQGHLNVQRGVLERRWRCGVDGDDGEIHRVAILTTTGTVVMIAHDHDDGDDSRRAATSWAVGDAASLTGGRVDRFEIGTCSSNAHKILALPTWASRVDAIAVQVAPHCPVRNVGVGAFHSWKHALRIDLSRASYLRTIAADFACFSGVTLVDLGGWSVVEVHRDFFVGCAALTAVTASAPCSLQRIGNRAFASAPEPGKLLHVGCGALTTVDLRHCDGLRSIGSDFCRSSGVTALDLGGWSITQAGEYFFADCCQLTSVGATSAPCTVERLASHAFERCSKLVALDLTRFTRLSVILDRFCSAAGLTGVDMGGWTVAEIGNSFLAWCPSLRFVVASAPCSELRCIGSQAFVGCTELECVSLPRQCPALEAVGDDFGAMSGVTHLDLAGECMRWRRDVQSGVSRSRCESPPHNRAGVA